MFKSNQSLRFKAEIPNVKGDNRNPHLPGINYHKLFLSIKNKLRRLDTVIKCIQTADSIHNIAIQDILTLHIENSTTEVGLLFGNCLIKVPGIITPMN